MTDAHPDTMIGRRNPRILADGCLDCGASLVLCESFADMERRRCCPTCRHPE